MIPLYLYMRNFMCYREQSLELRGIQLACLTGDNGHGKSAILDAITWSLWGYSRVGARRDDELIHIGQDEMEVEFEFELGEFAYRVIRKRSKSKRGYSGLELQGWDAEKEHFRPLTEPTITQTQKAIIDLLRMDYDTFVNSAFLLQGRADEFTIKRPGERKRVLGNVLGLDIYTQYEQAAKELARTSRAHADQIVAAIEQIDQELDREPEYKSAVRTAEAELVRLRDERINTEQDYERIRIALQETESAQQQLVDLNQRIDQAQNERDRLSVEMAAHQAKRDVLQDALTHKDEIEQGFAACEQAINQNEAMNAKLGELVLLRDRRSALEQTITEARHELEKAKLSATEKVNQLEQTASALDREPEWDAARVELKQLDDDEQTREQIRLDVQNLTAEIATLQTENKQAQTDAEQIKDKIVLLQAGQASADTQAACPLCGQPLGEDGCTQLITTLEQELERKRAAYRSRNEQIKLVRQQIKSIQDGSREIERALLGRAALQRKEAALAHTVEEARAAYHALPGARETMQTIDMRLQNQDFAQDTMAKLQQVEQDLGKLGYDAAAHQQIKEQITNLHVYQDKMQTLREASTSMDIIQLAIAQLEQQRIDIDERITTNQAQAGELVPVVAQLPDLQRQALQARQTLETAHDREQQANIKLGAARTKIEYCADLRKQRLKRQEQERALREQQSIYQELQLAFGKNGVQAMLIETAIPDIEEEANHLLARMTHGRMHVRFETQRETKKGEAAETLDIYISDELGTRSYETFSGGERYRINFAIRVALSKLLARRAGAQLEMLVIDEGFGTQDNEGRDGLLDAINAVSSDFGCILAITHIDELKDAFNVRIHVDKTAAGSELTII
ncbi:MAG: SMC family ATPase [Anaerolineae bacterium]|nr:SMC family ATPase [Anaerolineae bacterium]